MRYRPPHMDILEEYFETKPRKTWAYSFRPKEGACWKAKPGTRIARTSVDEKDWLLFTIGAGKKVQDCKLDSTLRKIIEQHKLPLETEDTTAGNADRTYVGFDLASESCTGEKLRAILEEVKQAVAGCSDRLKRPL
jgi:hypothetical protein